MLSAVPAGGLGLAGLTGSGSGESGGDELLSTNCRKNFNISEIFCCNTAQYNQ